MSVGPMSLGDSVGARHSDERLERRSATEQSKLSQQSARMSQAAQSVALAAFPARSDDHCERRWLRIAPVAVGGDRGERAQRASRAAVFWSLGLTVWPAQRLALRLIHLRRAICVAPRASAGLLACCQASELLH